MMKENFHFRLHIFFTYILIIILSQSLLAQYAWPVGLNANQQQNITSTFMEHRPGRYHAGIDITPVDGHWNTYNVRSGYITDIENFGWPNEHNERIIVDELSYIHVDVNDLLTEGMWIDTDTWLGSIYEPNPSGRHLHFEEGGQFLPSPYAWNPFDCTYGIQPYTDNARPDVTDIEFYRQPSGAFLPNGNLDGNVDIKVHCNDPVSGGLFGAVYELAYQVRTTNGDTCGLPKWNIRFDYWSTNTGFNNIWHSDDHIWVSNFLDPNTGQSTDDYWDTSKIRNGDFRMHIIAKDLSCSPNQNFDYYENITINNDPLEHGLNVISPQEWFGEHRVVGVYDPNVSKYVMHVTNGNTLVFDRWSRVRISSNTWLIIDPGAALIIENGAEVCLEGTGEIIGQPNGTIQCNSNNLSFLGSGACFYVKGDFSFADNLTYDFNNGGLLVVDGGELTVGDNTKLVFQNDADGLEVKSGSTILFGDDAEIIINGKMDAQGTAAAPITFKSSYKNPNLGNYWRGITFNDAADDESIIKHAVIENSWWGVFANNAAPTIENSTIRNCHLYGIRMDNANGVIRNNVIENIAISAGLYLRYANPLIGGNVIKDNNQQGIYLYQSSPYLYNNHIYDNFPYGIYAYSYSSPKLGLPDPGHNIIESNSYGIYASYYANPFLGVSMAPPEEGGRESLTTLGGYNSLYENSTREIKATNYCDVTAQLNWWGQHPPAASSFENNATSSIDYSVALTSDPNLPSSQKQVAGFGNNALPGEEQLFPEGGITPRQLLRLARRLRLHNQPRRALPVYRRLIRQHSRRIEARWGVMELLETFTEAGMDSALAALQNFVTARPDAKMAQVVSALLGREHLKRGNKTIAIANAQQIAQNYPGTESEKNALFDLFNLYFFDESDSIQAQIYLGQLQSRYPDAEQTLLASLLAGSGKENVPPTPVALKPAGQKAQNRTTAKPESFALLQNYPNPFNPETTIDYHLPSAAQVTLTVYNILGQKVAILANTFQEAGIYQAVWNGKDETGKVVPSGVYIYRISANSLSEGSEKFVQQKKMILMR